MWYFSLKARMTQFHENEHIFFLKLSFLWKKMIYSKVLESLIPCYTYLVDFFSKFNVHGTSCLLFQDDFSNRDHKKVAPSFLLVSFITRLSADLSQYIIVKMLLWNFWNIYDHSLFNFQSIILFPCWKITVVEKHHFYLLLQE